MLDFGDKNTKLDITIVRDLVNDQFPALQPVSPRFLKAGCDSEAYEINGTYVFRFPQRAEVQEQLAREQAILPRLARHVPAQIPSFEFHGIPSAALDLAFVGSPRLLHGDFLSEHILLLPD